MVVGETELIRERAGRKEIPDGGEAGGAGEPVTYLKGGRGGGRGGREA